jgi:hypothetical protein
MKKLTENIEIEESIFSKKYQKSLHSDKSRVPFNEEAISVAKIVYTIILADRPKPRYYITKATYLLGFLKRITSSALLDRVLLKIG